MFNLDKYIIRLKDKLKARSENKETLSTKKVLQNALDRLEKGDFDIPVTSGLHRLVIDKDLDPAILKRLGYFSSKVAVPERGQKQWTTYRHIFDNSHLHKHKDKWIMHKDEYPSIQAVLKRLEFKRSNKTPIQNIKKSGKNLYNALLQGTGHAVIEGLPGYSSYLSGMVGNTPTLDEAHNIGREKYLIGKAMSGLLD